MVVATLHSVGRNALPTRDIVLPLKEDNVGKFRLVGTATAFENSISPPSILSMTLTRAIKRPAIKKTAVIGPAAMSDFQLLSVRP